MVPVVRYMILCHDWGVDPFNSRRVNIYGLLSTITSEDEPRFPLIMPDLCIFLALTETRGPGTVQIIIAFEETGLQIYASPEKSVIFSDDPLEIVGLPVRIVNSRFPMAGMYSVQFWYNGTLVAERPLRLR